MNKEPLGGVLSDGLDPLGMNDFDWREFDKQVDMFFQNDPTLVDPSMTLFNAPDLCPNPATQNAAGYVPHTHPHAYNDAPALFLPTSSVSLPVPASPYTTTNYNAPSSHLSGNHVQISDPFVPSMPSTYSNFNAQPPPASVSTVTPDVLASTARVVLPVDTSKPETDIPVSLNSMSIPPSASLTLVSKAPALAPSTFENRRSGRPLVPSKRIEQLNMIGAKTAPSTSTRSENVVPGQCPEWVILAKKHFLEHDLGVEWISCVEGWLVVEEQLGFGTIPGFKVSSLIKRHLL